MIYSLFSRRQLLSMLWWQQPRYKDRDAIIADGSIRSGKTVSMTDGFVLWSMSCFNHQSFAICGKTIESLRRNVILPLRDWLPGDFTIVEKRNENRLIISTSDGKENSYHLFGGRDESSYMLIQGMTLAGVMFDEVALMPRSFVEQACARCSVPGSKYWFNCNPHSPEHWFYKEWVKKHKEKNALRLHFTMDDNLALDASIKARYESMYSGVFYQRYIKGLWVLAEGVIYQAFTKDSIVPTVPRNYTKYYISMDYGIQNPTAMLLFGLCDGVWYQVNEFYHSGRESGQQKTDEEYYDDLCGLAGDLPVRDLIIDPSASSFIALVRKNGRFRVRKANNDVLDGIQHTATMIQEKRLLVNDCCERTIQEYGLYSWQEKTSNGADKPIKENDHAMDATRYFVNTTKVWKPKDDYVPLLERRNIQRGGYLIR